MALLAPRRQRGFEIMDDPGTNPDLVVRSLADVALANRYFGGSRAVISELLNFLDAAPDLHDLTFLDVGTGIGDIPAAAAGAAAKRGVRIDLYGIDASEASLRASATATFTVVRGNALSLPFQSGSFDVVVCSQVVHHFVEPELSELIRELNRVARRRVIVSDIRRSWFAAAGIWLISFPLRFHPVSRHDGVVSVMRGFTKAELRTLVKSATQVSPKVRSHLGFRVTASWKPLRSMEG